MGNCGGGGIFEREKQDASLPGCSCRAVRTCHAGSRISDLVHGCLEHKPNRRPLAHEIYNVLTLHNDSDFVCACSCDKLQSTLLCIMYPCCTVSLFPSLSSQTEWNSRCSRAEGRQKKSGVGTLVGKFGLPHND